MNFLKALETSASGLSAQRLRLNLISNNLANVNTTRTPDGGPYRRQEAVFEARPAASFHQALASQMTDKSASVMVSNVVEDQREPKVKYDPSHPDADDKGYVAFPNINVMEEMVNMISATRSYEANVTAIKSAKDMALRALDIGK